MNQTRRNFIKRTCAASAAVAAAQSVFSAAGNESAQRASQPITPSRPPEWRNRVDSMSYRQLGRTGLMVSEIVMGAIGKNQIPVAKHAIERGLNYLDTAERYGNGRSEEAIGELVSEPGMREKILISTKISSFLPALDEWATDILKGLPTEKQEAIRQQAAERMNRMGVYRAGYHFNYFPGHDVELPEGYLSNEVLLRHGNRENGAKRLRDAMQSALDGSLRRLKTDHIDILHCPHGARLPVELEQPVIREFLGTAKKEGKIRFSGLSIHSDVPQVLTRASELRYYDMSMIAYNIANQGSMELALSKAASNGMGLIAMKAARAINRPIGGDPVPQWRIDKLNTAIPGSEGPEVKAYAWVLQNPNLAAVISAMNSTEMVDENLAIAGRKIELQGV